MTTEAQQQVKENLSGALDQWEKVQVLLLDPNNLIIVFLFFFGIMLKKTKHVPDWIIIFIVPTVGLIVGVGLYSVVQEKLPALVAAMLGFVYGAGATFFHSCLKQILESPIGKGLLKIPMVPLLADWVGAETYPEGSHKNSPSPTSTPQPPT